MRQLLHSTIYASVFLICIKASAQPVFTYADFAPQAGDQYTTSDGQYLNPGSAGANQTWNFSAAFVSGNSTYTVPSVSSIPAGSQYPACNLGIGTSGFEMMQITTSEYNCVGNTITPGQAHFIYSDFEKRFVFPMNYNNNFNDAFSGVSNAMQTTNRTGSQTVTYDGYGTIITPIATYTNAIRIRRNVTWTDSTQTGTNTCTGDYYYWFVSGYRYPVAQIWSLSCLSSGAMFLQNITIGINELKPLNTVSIFPNPASDLITIQGIAQNEMVKIYNVNGDLVKSGNGPVISVAELAAGAYVLQCVSNGRTVIKRFVLY